MGCNPECYTKGRGCVASNDGKCAILYDDYERPKVKSFQDAFKEMVKNKYLTPPGGKSYIHKTGKRKGKIVP